VIQLFVAGTNKYYNQYFNTLESDRNAYDFWHEGMGDVWDLTVVTDWKLTEPLWSGSVPHFTVTWKIMADFYYAIQKESYFQA
jgi:hypothetical protein